MAHYTVLSLGAGVQSSTLAMLAEKGIIGPKPDCAIFADTGWESKAVYEWLDWLESQLSYPVHRVSNGNIREDQLTARVRGTQDKGQRWAALPYFVASDSVGGGMIRRQCTKEYKITPIERFIREELIGIQKGQRVPKGVTVESWRGISADESQRMKPSKHKWEIVRYPLAMELQWTRGDCLAWFEQQFNVLPPRSSCIGCPFHSNYEWLEMKINRPQEWADAVAFDNAIRKSGGMRGDSYIHRSRLPLDQAPLDNPDQIDLFGNECEGMCGV